MIPAFATGGAVYGPGGPTEDRVPALLSAGEHVLTAREVLALGGHAEVERFRRLALVGALPRFAAGGAVRSPLSAPRLAPITPARLDNGPSASPSAGELAAAVTLAVRPLATELAAIKERQPIVEVDGRTSRLVDASAAKNRSGRPQRYPVRHA